jgi:rod shape-determining protein MreD
VSRLGQGALLVGAALVQVTLIGRLDPALPQPNLVLALVVARAWLRGGSAGLGWALMGGLLLDLAGIGPLGAHALAVLSAAYVAGALAASFENDARPAFAILAGAAGGAVYGAVLLAMADSLGLAQVSLRAALPLVLEGALSTAVLVPLGAAVMTRWGGAQPLQRPSW